MAGIGFAVVLMFMQMGFRNALFDSTVKVVTDLDADLLLVNQAQYALPARQSFDRKRIEQARGCPGVAAVYPLYTETMGTEWQPAIEAASPIRSACWPSTWTTRVFLTPEIRAQTAALREPGTALIDSRSKKQYGMPPDHRADPPPARGGAGQPGRSAWWAPSPWAPISPTTAT